jgi:gliding motility-associated-like protein
VTSETRKVYITLTDGKADSDAKERAIEVIDRFEELDIPNAFTPDGNGANDEWKIRAGKEGVGKYNEAVVRIYNRRGTLVYETIGFDAPWNGMMNGEVLPADTYYYTIELNFLNKIYKGIVTILR